MPGAEIEEQKKRPYDGKGGHQGKKKLLREYLGRSEINSRNSFGHTQLYVTVLHGSDEDVKSLLLKKADPNITAFNGNSPVYLAARKGYVNKLSALVAAGANIDSSALMAAVISGCLEVVRACFENDTSIRVQINDVCDQIGNTVLHFASLEGHADIANYLISQSADVDSRNHAHETPVFLAAQQNNLSVLQALLDNGADVCRSDLNQVSPVAIAIYRGNIDAVKLFVERGWKPSDSKCIISPLYIAVQEGDMVMAELLIANDVDVNVHNQTSRAATALHVASEDGRSNMIQKLLEHKAAPDSTCSYGQTPLVVAIDNKHERSASILMQAKADVNKCDNTGQSALHYSVSRKSPGTLMNLLEHGAHIDAKSNTGQTPLTTAVLTNCEEAIHLLVQNGAKVEIASHLVLGSSACAGSRYILKCATKARDYAKILSCLSKIDLEEEILIPDLLPIVAAYVADGDDPKWSDLLCAFAQNERRAERQV